MIQVYKYDEQGFYTFETYFVDEIGDFETDIPCNTEANDTFYKPKLDGAKWIEGATEEEIAEWKKSQKIDICPEPTTEEKVENLINQVVIMDEIIASLTLEVL